MPLYEYKCHQCNHADTEFMQMKDCNADTQTVECPVCRKPSFVRQVSLPNTDLTEFHTPIEMHSVAATDWSELREIQRKCPDVKISDNPDDELFGVPIAANRKQKLQILAATGFCEKT